MKKQRRILRNPMLDTPKLKKYALLGFFLLLGMILGQIVPEEFLSDSRDDLYSAVFSISESEMENERFLSVFFAFVRCPFYLFLSAFSSIGWMLIAVILTLQGFSVSLCAAMLAGITEQGVRLSLASLGIRCLFVFPISLFLGAEALRYCAAKADTRCFGTLARCFLLSSCLLCLGALLECRLVPGFLHTAIQAAS